MIVTVTLDIALDRTLTVPHFQMSQRHRASQVLTLAGGKGSACSCSEALESPSLRPG
jgi:fructose-1-phosphate kinase PfkB-like protein